MRTVLRYAWAGPATVFGIALATLALWRGRVTVVDGVVEAYGPLLHFLLSRTIPLAGGACAMTFGHVTSLDARVAEVVKDRDSASRLLQLLPEIEPNRRPSTRLARSGHSP